MPRIARWWRTTIAAKIDTPYVHSMSFEKAVEARPKARDKGTLFTNEDRDMDTQKYLDQVAYVKPSQIPDDDGAAYYSNFDNSYITRVGMEDDIKFLADLEITDELTHGVGFSPLHNKWFGWSHRACHGFTIGSKCEKGDCHYSPANLDDTLANLVRFWDGEYHAHTTAKVIDDKTIRLSWTYTDDVPNKSLRGKSDFSDHEYDKDNFGRGEWVAETMEDAKQMAIDFNEGVS